MQYPRNGYVLGLHRTIGGGVLARMLSVHTSAVRRGPYVGIFTENTSVPDGYGMSGTVPPYNEDNLSSYNQVQNPGALTGPLVTARNMATSMTNANTMTPSLKILVQLAVSMVATCTLTAPMKAVASMAVTLANNGNISASLNLFAFMQTNMLNQHNTLTGVMVGHASMSANMTSEGTAVTASACAAAVWQRVIEAGFSAEELLRIIAAVQAGDAADMSTNPTFTGLDGTTTRVAGTVSGGTRTVTTVDGT